MKPDVKKIIADIKATKGNRKFCNGLAGTLQDDNYASSICKYVKTVTPERIDLLIEYTENLEAEVTDMAVQLANAESKCRELAAENAGMKHETPDLQTMMSALDAFFADEDVPERAMLEAYNILRGAVETPATDAFLAEVRAQGVEMYAEHLTRKAIASGENKNHAYAYLAANFAAQLRKGAAL